VEVEGTVKTFKRSDGHVWLMPHNPVYMPILGDNATISGEVATPDMTAPSRGAK
jgi:repressor LexA